MIKIKEKVYLISPLYLGDAFVINALVRSWAEQCQEVHVPTLPQYVATVACLYSEMSNVKVVPYLGLEHEQSYIKQHDLDVINFRTLYEMHKLPIKHHPEPMHVPVNWDRQIYEYFDVPFSRRYKDFQLPVHIPNSQSLYDTLNPHHGPYVLWHGDSHTLTHSPQIDLAEWRRSIGLTERKIIQVVTGHTANLLDYVTLIEHAEEIHCIPSSFHCLVDSMVHRTKAELFFHDVKVSTIMQVNCRWNAWRWHSVYYDHKI